MSGCRPEPIERGGFAFPRAVPQPIATMSPRLRRTPRDSGEQRDRDKVTTRYAFRPGIPQWARDFDGWVEDALSRFDVDALVDFQTRAPAVRLALPTWEHYAPLFVAAGAVSEKPPRKTFPITGWWMDGAFTRRSVQFD